MHDLRIALRQLLKNPGFTAVAVRTRELGIRRAFAASPAGMIRMVARRAARVDPMIALRAE